MVPRIGPVRGVRGKGNVAARHESTVDGISGVVASVEFNDGQFWIPSRAAIASDSRLRSVIPPSPEEQRLMQIYRKRGLQGVIEELKRGN